MDLITEDGIWTIQVIYPGSSADLPENASITAQTEQLVATEDAAEVNPETTEIAVELPLTQTDIPVEEEHSTSRQSANFQILGTSYSCQNCGKSYNAKRNLMRHLKVECGKDPQFGCPFCDYKNHRKNEMRKHCRKRHGVLVLDK